MRLLWLPQVLRAAGMTVHEVSGWRTRGADSFGPVRGITCHHTGGSRNSTDAGEIGVLLNGSASAPPPIAQLYLSRSGEWWVIASGLCFHNRVGWGGPNKGFGNDNILGIEAQHSGGDEPWTTTQYRSYVVGVGALVEHKAPGFDVSVNRVAGHKEHQPGPWDGNPDHRSVKTDPTFNMTRFRIDVATALEDDMATPVEVWTHDLLNGDGVDEAYRVVLRMDANIKALQAQMTALAAANTTDAETDAKLKKVTDELKAELARIEALDVARDARAQERDQGLATQVANVDEEVVAKLSDPALDPEQVAEVLRAALGDRADDVFRAGLGQ